MARTFTITQEGESREFTVATGVGPSGVDGVDAEVTLASVRAAVPNMVEVASPAENDFIQRGPSGWLTKSIEQVKTALGLGSAAYVDTGTGAANAILGNDSRLTDARTPTAHKASHATGGSDALTAADIGAATAAQGTDERVPTAAGLTTKFSTNKATLVDADKIAIFDSAASDTPKHGLLSAIVSHVIDVGRTLAGAWAFSSTTRPTSSGTGTPASNSLIMTSDGDARYSKVYIGFATTDQDVTNSSAYTNSTQCAITIPEAGSYLVETSEQVISSAWATAGMRSALATTGVITSSVFVGAQAPRSAASFLNQAFTYNNNWDVTTAISSASQSVWIRREGIVVFSTAGTIAISFAQNVAIAANYARLQARSFVKATKIS